jgi:hypothetical protein
MKILKEEISNMKYLFGYKAGVVISEQEDEIESRMRRRKDELINLIQFNVGENDPNNYSDEFEWADNIITWSVDELVEQPGNEWLSDRYSELMDYAKEEFAEELFEVYRDNVTDDFDDEEDF